MDDEDVSMHAGGLRADVLQPTGGSRCPTLEAPAKEIALALAALSPPPDVLGTLLEAPLAELST